MDLIWRRHIKLRPWYVPWGREVDLPDGLLFEPVLGLLLSHLGYGQEIFDGRQSLPETSGTEVNACKAGGELFIWLHRDLRGVPAAR